MPWPIRSHQFALYDATPTANAHVFLGTVPTGKKWLIKEWFAYNASGTALTMYLHVLRSGVYTLWDLQALGANTGVLRTGRSCVLNAGDQIQGQWTSAQHQNLIISGAELG
jgi:hypothetical protein